MSEKRRPSLVLNATVEGKGRVLVELYDPELWPGKRWKRSGKSVGGYRVRVNRRWQHGDYLFTLSQVMDQFRKWLAAEIKDAKRQVKRERARQARDERSAQGDAGLEAGPG